MLKREFGEIRWRNGRHHVTVCVSCSPIIVSNVRWRQIEMMSHYSTDVRESKKPRNYESPRLYQFKSYPSDHQKCDSNCLAASFRLSLRDRLTSIVEHDAYPLNMLDHITIANVLEDRQVNRVGKQQFIKVIENSV